MFQYVSQYCTFFSAIFVLCIDLIIYSVTCSLFTAFVVHLVYFIRNCVVVLIASIFLFVFQSVCLALYHYFILWFYFSSIAYSTFRDCSIIAKTMILIKTCQLMSLSCFFFFKYWYLLHCVRSVCKSKNIVHCFSFFVPSLGCSYIWFW